MMANAKHAIGYPLQGDLLVDGRYLFEVGGSDKGYAQIRNLPDSFVVADDIPVGFGKFIISKKSRDATQSYKTV